MAKKKTAIQLAVSHLVRCGFRLEKVSGGVYRLKRNKKDRRGPIMKQHQIKALARNNGWIDKEEQAAIMERKSYGYLREN